MSGSLWKAPRAQAPVLAEVRVPGSKSMTNRALLLAALASGRSQISQPLHSRDTELMTDALRSLGAVIVTEGDTWTVTGGAFAASPTTVAVGNAGTVLRFVPAIAALSKSSVSFDGDEAARRRPVGPLLNALRELGAEVVDGGRGALPFTVHGAGHVTGGAVSIDASSSSQLVSALLLAGARYDRGVEIHHVGARDVPNAPHIAMSVAMIRDRGVSVDADTNHWAVSPGDIRAIDQVVEPDLSSAAPFLAAAVVTGGTVRIPDWPHTSTQPGAALPALLEQFGASSHLGDDGLVVRGGGSVAGVHLDLRNAGELTPVIASIAVLGSSPSRLVGIDYLRGHETDRIDALVRELSALGADVHELPDGLEIRPKPLHGTVFSTYDDHRMAMAAAVVGLVVDGVEVENVETTAKTMPGFVTMWADAVNGQGAVR